MKIGVDLGGSHIGVGLIENEKLVDSIDKIFSEEEKKEICFTIIKSIEELVDEILTKNNLSIDKIEKIGIASPGTISNGVIVKAGNLGIKNFDIVSKLKEKFSIPITIRNDGKCAALAEKQYGAMKDYDDCLFINIGTGIGGAVFMGGKLLEPKKNSGFELGHMVIEKNGNPCTCGKRGCFETYCSIKALKSRITNTLGIENKDISGQYLREVLMVEHREEVRQDIEEYIENMKTGICNLIDIFEPEVICFGGSFSYYEGNPLLEALIKRIKEPGSTFNDDPNLQIVTAHFKNNAGIIGATV